MKERIAVFDFDGTITTKDTLLEFIRYAKGTLLFCWGFILFSPLLVAYKMRLYPNWKVKERIFSCFFRGMPVVQFNALCEGFYKNKGKELLREDACATIRKHLSQGDSVIIVSASIHDWVLPFGKALGVDAVIGTEVAVSPSGNLTGKFLTRNCYGMEKVERIKRLYPDYGAYTWIAYGDSAGDRQLLDFADEKHYKIFISK